MSLEIISNIIKIEYNLKLIPQLLKKLTYYSLFDYSLYAYFEFLFAHF